MDLRDPDMGWGAVGNKRPTQKRDPGMGRGGCRAPTSSTWRHSQVSSRGFPQLTRYHVHILLSDSHIVFSYPVLKESAF